ncbi:MAG: electron transport complex subunit RsxA [Oscillospiraceae bacterium]|nr:electron transport complex subunit RsxA [Oscillospiraceae bacterium]MBQ6846847.1 electron transport complex subunit RsxA [Oscillospiraceae bacterium]MBQ7119549.1 electron transport complex subunit RsxA [Oscillospiraceae bacterium]
MSFSDILSLSLIAIFAENIVLGQMLGITPFLKNSQSMKSAVKAGVSVTLTMLVVAILAYVTEKSIIMPFRLDYMRTVIFVTIVAGGLCICEAILRKKSSYFAEKTEISPSYIAVNTAVLGIMLITVNANLDFLSSVIYAFASGIGFTVAIIIFASVRERLEYSDVPKAFEGVPIALITAGLIALAFSGFQGIKFM